MRSLARRIKHRLRPPGEADPIVVDMGNDVFIGIPRAMSLRPADLLTVGRHTYSVPQVQWHAGDTGRVRIGSWGSIHHTVVIFVGGEHNPQWVTTYAVRARFGLPGALTDGQPRSRGDVVIGNDVYIGYGCTVLSGVTIGDGAVIGACSVVTRDVEPYAIVAGSPAIFRRWRFDEGQRRRLLDLQWWDWDDDKIKAEVNGLCSDRIDEFLDRHAP